MRQRNGALVHQISYHDSRREIVERARFKNEKKMAGADRSAVVSLIKELSDDSILQEARSCEDEEFVSFLLRRERQSPVHIGNYFERIKPLSVWCFRFLKSFLNVKSCSQLFGTLVSYLPGSASWTKEWGETYH